MDDTRSSTYWAALPTAEAARAVDGKIDAFYRWIRSSGSYARWRRLYRAYYAGFVEFASLGSQGEQGELIKARVNHLRNLIEHQIVAVTGQELSFEPRAANTDHKSQTQTVLSKGILEYVQKNKGLGKLRRKAVEMALVLDEAYLLKTWDATAGREFMVDPDTGSIVKSGDIKFELFPPVDAPCDVTKDSADSHQWRCVRRYSNRYDLAAKWPELASRLLTVPSKLEDVQRVRLSEFIRYESMIAQVDSDDVPVWHFFHDRCDSIPDGRVLVFCTPDVVLFDGPMPYKEMPVYRLAPSDMMGVYGGYSDSNDAMGVQQAIDATHSTIMSNQAAFGVQNIWSKKGSGLTVSALSGGLNLIESQEPPQALQLTATAPEVFNYLDRLMKDEETLLGINAVQRGQMPGTDKMSGAALALLKSQTLEFLAGLRQADQEFMASVATGVIKDYQAFAQAPQVAMLAGKTGKAYLKEFTGSDLDKIERVEVDLGNPMSSSTSGRMTIAQDLLNLGGMTPQQYLQVIKTGNLDVATEGASSELLNIKSENERLAEGEDVAAVFTDNHPLHIKEHATVYASPDARENPDVMAIVAGHIQEHVDLWKGTDPAVLAALGVMPPPMAMGPPGLPPGPGAPPPDLAPGTGAPEMQAPPGVDGDALPGMPQAPRDPMTGQRVPLAS